jgi:hypothetical protein
VAAPLEAGQCQVVLPPHHAAAGAAGGGGKWWRRRAGLGASSSAAARRAAAAAAADAHAIANLRRGPGSHKGQEESGRGWVWDGRGGDYWQLRLADLREGFNNHFTQQWRSPRKKSRGRYSQHMSDQPVFHAHEMPSTVPHSASICGQGIIWAGGILGPS